MHGDPQHRGSVTTVSIGDLELTSIDHEAQAAQTEGDEDAEGRRLRIEEDERGRNSHPNGQRNAGDDTGGSGWHQSDLFGPADRDGREGLNGGMRDEQHVAGRRHEPEPQPAEHPEGLIHVFHVPAQALPKALGLGAALGIEKVILATDEETVATAQERLQQGTLQLWSATQHGEFVGCLITEVQEWATGAVLAIRYMAGKNPQDWLPIATEVMKPLALQAGCETVIADTREGMRKFLISQGWRKTSIRMRLDLNGKQI